MILTQGKDGFYTSASEQPGCNLSVHPETDCEGRGCAIHNHPSDHPLNSAELNWRQDRGILERICTHGIGHPDRDAANYLESIGQGFQNVHGCDGCC